jgi:hypothetical protein
MPKAKHIELLYHFSCEAVGVRDWRSVRTEATTDTKLSTEDLR